MPEEQTAVAEAPLRLTLRVLKDLVKVKQTEYERLQ